MKIVLKDSSDDLIIQRGNESVSAFTQIKDAISGGGLTGVTLNGSAATVTNNVAALTAAIPTKLSDITSAHTHPISEVTNLQSTLNAKVSSVKINGGSKINPNNGLLELTIDASTVGALPTGTTLDGISDGATRKLSNYATTGTVNTLNGTVTAHTADTTIHVTSQDKLNWDAKADVFDIVPPLRLGQNGLELGYSTNFTVNGVNPMEYLELSNDNIIKLEHSEKALSASTLDLSINNSTYVLTLSGKSIDGSVTINETVDLPLEEMVVSGSYNNTTKKVVLTLKNGSDIEFSVADLVSGLQSEITSSNKLSADLVQDGTTNKVVTASEKSTWNGKQDALSNASVLTGITSQKVTNWDNAATSAHSHSNKDALDNLTQAVITNSHSHTNKTVLDGITTAKTSQWDNAISGVSLNGSNVTVSNHVATLNGALVPSFTSADNGKILMVVNGALAWVSPSTIYTGSGAPSSSQGNNGDIYLQTS